MTIAEYRVALDALDDAAFAAFRRDFGGDFATRQQYVDDFVYHPEHERRLCQLLAVATEADKVAALGQDAVNLSKERNRLAQEANAYSASAQLPARQANAIATVEQPIVFISCGQRTATEKELGEQICRLVREHTSFEPYFAEYQTSLEGLSKNIFGALNRSVGLIAVMHCRGNVQPQDLVRASVWVEQEIAIAAFLQGVMGRSIHVAAFSEIGVAREGVREVLLLNPIDFSNNDDVLSRLQTVLPQWASSSNVAHPALEVEARVDKAYKGEFVVSLSVPPGGSMVRAPYLELDLSGGSFFLATYGLDGNGMDHHGLPRLNQASGNQRVTFAGTAADCLHPRTHRDIARIEWKGQQDKMPASFEMPYVVRAEGMDASRGICKVVFHKEQAG